MNIMNFIRVGLESTFNERIWTSVINSYNMDAFFEVGFFCIIEKIFEKTL